MSEATLVEPGVPSGVANVVLPEPPMPKPETPNKAEISVTSPESNIKIYQDVMSKDAKNGGRYQMTDKEAEAFLFVQEQIMSGAIKDPGLSEAPETKSTPTPKDLEKSEGEAGSKDLIKDVEKADLSKIPDSVYDSIQKVMNKVGAKDVSQLPEKVEGLIKQMTATGGELGGKAKQLQLQLDQHTNFMQGLRSKDPEALSHLAKLTGLEIKEGAISKEAKAQIKSNPLTLEDPEEYIDNKLAPVVKGLIDEVKALKEANETLLKKENQRETTSQEQKAQAGWVDDVVGLIADHAEDYGLSTSEARALATFYWSAEGAKSSIHPKFQKVHELIDFAYKNNMPNLETAHVMMQYKTGKFAQKLIDAQKTGQKEAQFTETPNAAISSKQGRTKNDIPDPQITEDMVTAMERGDLSAIPDDIFDQWTDESGNLVKAKIPQRFHKIAFGRAG